MTMHLHIFSEHHRAVRAFRTSELPGTRRSPQMEIIDGDDVHRFICPQSLDALHGLRFTSATFDDPFVSAKVKDAVKLMIRTRPK